ncbi:uncharacterized protein [Anolis sagrei]|uniref:uncharacterized protein n=1 Tax=Anolis sagrei TaxID=38937 RepID=UPI0035201C6B
MASVREVSGITEDLLCPVCLSIFQDPRMLVCGHNFCLSCLERCVLAKGQLQGTCPECRDPFDLQDAVHNRVLANLSEKARLLKLEAGCQSGVTGSWHICEEHEEPLKLFCSQDEAPVCVICRDLPQHQGHNFLPIKNAVNSYQDKLKASLGPLKDQVKWATNHQSYQQEKIEELEDLTQNLYGLIFIAFEELREILNEREQNMMETVKQMKEDNLAAMKRNMEYLKEHGSSHEESISSIQAALEEPNEFAFLKETKELMERISDHLREKNDKRESKAVDGGLRLIKGEESEDELKDMSENKAEENKEDKAIGDKVEAYGEVQDVLEDEDAGLVHVNPALEELQTLLDFENLKDMLKSISIEEMFVPSSPYGSPSLEGDVLPSEDRNIFEESEEKETAVAKEPDNNTEIRTAAPGMSSLAKQTPMPRSVSNAAPNLGGAFNNPLFHSPTFQMPPFQPLTFYSTNPMPGRGNVHCWRPPPMRSCSMQRQIFYSSFAQGRGNSPNRQGSQPSIGLFPTYSQQNSWKYQRRDPNQPRGGQAGRQGQSGFNKQKPQPSGGSQSGVGSIKNETHKPKQVHVSRTEGDWRSSQSSVDNSTGQSREPPKPKSGPPPGQGSSGQGRKSGKKRGGASSGNRATHPGGRGDSQGSSSAKRP